MTFEEAIKHCEETAEQNETKAQSMGRQFIGSAIANYQNDCLECAAEHRQLAEWLRELKEQRNSVGAIKLSEMKEAAELIGALKSVINKIYIETTTDHYGDATLALTEIDKILNETRCTWNE